MVSAGPEPIASATSWFSDLTDLRRLARSTYSLCVVGRSHLPRHGGRLGRATDAIRLPCRGGTEGALAVGYQESPGRLDLVLTIAVHWDVLAGRRGVCWITLARGV